MTSLFDPSVLDFAAAVAADAEVLAADEVAIAGRIAAVVGVGE